MTLPATGAYNGGLAGARLCCDCLESRRMTEMETAPVFKMISGSWRAAVVACLRRTGDREAWRNEGAHVAKGLWC